jgi:integral membrane protein (TIGR00529 family)
MELLKLALVILVIMLLMWRKVDLGLSLAAGSILLGLLFNMTALNFVRAVYSAIIDPNTLQLIFVVFMIQAMGIMMKENGSLERMVESLERIVRDRRVALVIPPALIGLLPTPGGAMLSAPMVEESGARMGLAPEQKTFINYWFRHLWEYWWPLYPGLIVSAAILQIPISDMMRVQWPLSLPAIFCGWFFGVIPLGKKRNSIMKESNLGKDLWNFNLSIWPIWILLLGLMAFKFPIVILMSVIIISLITTLKMNRFKIWEMFKKSFSIKIGLLMISVMVFKYIVSHTPELKVIPSILSGSGIPALIPLFLFPFITGVLTGVNQAYVGVSFPLLLPFFGNGSIDLKLVMFAYTAGFIGVIVSPAHLCLLLTKEYFKAEWSKIFQPLIPSAILLFLASLALLYL